MNPYTPAAGRYDRADRLYARCGRSGVLLPKVSLGFWHNFGRDADFERCRAIARYAFDHGITHFDLANNYGPSPGAAEETLGRLLREDLRPHRDELFIATKAGYDMWAGPYGNWGSRKHLLASLDRSLQRMGLDYVDLFYSHRYDPLTPLEETLQALVDAVGSGKALYVGISRWPLHALKVAERYLREHDTPLLLFQHRLNLLDRAPQEEGLLDFCHEAGVGFIAFSPLAQGLLTDKYLDGTIPEGSRLSRPNNLPPDALAPARLACLRSWNEQAARRGESLAEEALAWVLAQRGVTSVLVGASSTGQLARNLQCIDAHPIDPAETAPATTAS